MKKQEENTIRFNLMVARMAGSARPVAHPAAGNPKPEQAMRRAS